MADAFDVDGIAVDDDVAGKQPGEWARPQQPTVWGEFRPKGLWLLARAMQVVHHVEMIFVVESQRRPVQRTRFHTGQRLSGIDPCVQSVARAVKALDAPGAHADGKDRAVAADGQSRGGRALVQ